MVATSKKDNASDQVPATSSWYRCAVTTAVLSGVFSVVVLTFLLLNYGRSKMVGTPEETKLKELRSELRNKPDDQQLLSQIRQFDLQFRVKHIRALDRALKGGYLLLGGVVVFIISLRFAIEFKKKPPAPQPGVDQLKEQLINAKFARWAVTSGLAVLVLGSLFMVTRPQIDFAKAGAADASSYSMEDVAKNWTSFRGPNGAGISAYTNVPSRWDGKTGEGILWKTEIPLPGNNSPVVWSDRIFLSGADPNNRQVFCFNVSTGQLLWKGDVLGLTKKDEEPLQMSEETGYASPTVATDGRHVCAIFPTGDVGCFDFNGKKVWEQNMGRPDSAYGYASSLAVYKNMFLIQYDQGGVEDEKSNMIALDGFSGRIVWQTKRPVGNSWSSPIVAKVGEQLQIITCADPWVIAYNPAELDDIRRKIIQYQIELEALKKESNEASKERLISIEKQLDKLKQQDTEIWRVQCLSGDIAPSPTYANGLVFVIEPYSKVVAIKADGKGDVTKTNIAWVNDEGGPDICSPVSNGEFVFLMATEGLLQCLNFSDGKKVWEKDLQEYFLASPSLVGDKLYLLSEKGVMYIAEAGAEYKQLAKCELGEKCLASPAFANGRIYIRGIKNLYCIGNSN
jgi:outer membrane protein assembly factor BamB